MRDYDAAEGLQRFIDAQKNDFEIALKEIKNGKKQSHWMWYIFPQIAGLGMSETSRYYAIKDLSEARAFLEHPVLGKRLINICTALLSNGYANAEYIFGNPDVIKLRSSMTLFSAVPNANTVFNDVLLKFFNGEMDRKTLEKIVSP